MRIYLMYYEYVRKYVMSAQMFEVSIGNGNGVLD